MINSFDNDATAQIVEVVKSYEKTPLKTGDIKVDRRVRGGGKSKSSTSVAPAKILSGSDGFYSVQLYDSEGEPTGDPVNMIANRATIDDLAVGKHVVGVKISVETLG